MNKRIPYLILATGTLTSPLFAAPAYPGDWTKARLFTIFNMASNRNATNAEYNHIRDNVGMSMIEKNHGWRALNQTGQEPAAIIISDRLTQDNSNHIPTLLKSGRVLYAGHQIDSRYFINNQPNWVYDSDKLNASISGARSKWISQTNSWIGQSSGDKMGLFMDSTRTTSSNGTLDYNWGESMLRGINGFTMANGLDPNGEAKILTGHESLKSTDSIWMEDFFRGRMTPSERDEQANVLIALSYLDDTKPIVFASSGQHNSFNNQFDTAFRANLLVANQSTHFSWFDYTNGGADIDFYDADYGRKTGDPLAAARNDRYKFTRIFENCTVTYDANNQSSSLVWNQNNKTPSATHNVYEGENSSITRGSKKTISTASGNSYADLNGGGKTVWSNISVDGGETIVSFRIKCPSGTRKMGVYVNGSKQAVISHNKNDWTAKSARLVLNNGNNTIELRDSEGTTEFDVDYMAVPKPSSRYVGPQQAEDAVSSSSQVKTDRVAARDLYEDGANGMNLTWYARSNGVTRNLVFRVKAPSGTRKMGVYLNDSKIGTISSSSRTWTSRPVSNVKLANGVNKIELRDSENSAEFDVDYMIIQNH